MGRAGRGGTHQNRYERDAIARLTNALGDDVPRKRNHRKRFQRKAALALDELEELQARVLAGATRGN